MAHLFLDTEFNGHGGELISLALHNIDGPDFYEVADVGMALDPWVAEHVIPFVGKRPIGIDFTPALRAYLLSVQAGSPGGVIHVYADWPADFEHFFASLMIANHWEVDIPITAHLFHSGPVVSAIPHNALEDAKGLAAWYLANRALD